MIRPVNIKNPPERWYDEMLSPRKKKAITEVKMGNKYIKRDALPAPATLTPKFHDIYDKIEGKMAKNKKIRKVDMFKSKPENLEYSHT